ncbi:MAG: hypothetical protein FD119_2835 [Stygiobacter sp.]|nr:MAG: hypothetical protein FD119_2835 [Stygiobacter sp.]
MLWRDKKWRQFTAVNSLCHKLVMSEHNAALERSDADTGWNVEGSLWRPFADIVSAEVRSTRQRIAEAQHSKD